jgi:hypothetical protein
MSNTSLAQARNEEVVLPSSLQEALGQLVWWACSRGSTRRGDGSPVYEHHELSTPRVKRSLRVLSGAIIATLDEPSCRAETTHSDCALGRGFGARARKGDLRVW